MAETPSKESGSKQQHEEVDKVLGEKHACCRQGHLDAGTPVGEEREVAGLPTYVAGDVSKNSDKAVVIVTDVFGWRLVNTRLIADKYAQRLGVPVYVPDFHSGDSLSEQFGFMTDAPKGLWDHIARGARIAVGAPSLISWFRRHGDAVSIPIIDTWFTTLKAEGVNKVAAVGYCWGGRYAILQAAKPGMLCVVCPTHPSFVTAPADIEPIVTPSVFILAESDSIFPPAAVKATQDVMNTKAALPVSDSAHVPSEFHTFPGTVHGFAVRGDENDAHIAAARAEAIEKTAAFFAKYLGV